MNFYQVVFLLLSNFLICKVFCNDEINGQATLEVYHSLNNSPNGNDFFQRGVIYIKDKQANFQQKTSLTSQEKHALKESALNNGNYFLKIKNTVGIKSEVFTFIKACMLYESSLSDGISLYMDQTPAGPVAIGVSMITYVNSCKGRMVPENQLDSFNSTINLYGLTTAPSPDTQTFIHRMEQEKLEKARGEHGDNKSFFAKYWVYIVPLVIFIGVTSMTGQDGAPGGR